MTIKDLSALTGYSVGTISRVLNKQPNVSERARTVILEAAQAHGFQLNTNAKQLKQQHGTAIAVVVKGSSNELFGSLVEALQRRAAQTPYPLIVDYIDENDNEVLRAVQLCREKKPLGLMFLGGNRECFLQDFDKITVPAVLVTGTAEGLPFRNLSSVSTDDILAAKTAIGHLVSLGHRRIGILGGNLRQSDTSALRYQGCREALRDHGIDFSRDRDYVPSRFSFDGGYRAARELLERRSDVTALFAMSDVIAIGAIRALEDAGKRVPEDVSVVGVDGLAIGSYTVPRLTTLCQPVEELAERSLALLRQNMEDQPQPRHEILDICLKIRESTRTA